MKTYPVPKKGDHVVCIEECEDEDFGMSGIVLKGIPDLKIGNEYIIEDVVDFSQIPNRLDRNGIEIWTVEEYEWIKWCWTIVWIKGIGRTLLTHFEPKR